MMILQPVLLTPCFRKPAVCSKPEVIVFLQKIQPGRRILKIPVRMPAAQGAVKPVARIPANGFREIIHHVLFPELVFIRTPDIIVRKLDLIIEFFVFVLAVRVIVVGIRQGYDLNYEICA